MILSSRFCPSRISLLRQNACRCFHTSLSPRTACGPLRVLFCGSDDFSIASLRALNAERVNKTSAGIDSIDVVCRPGKRTGRGLKVITHPPIRDVTRELGLELHEIDTFTGWQPPDGINLIVAVSFGLLVPPRILAAARYGGLNVHPSILPDLRGAAPIQHTLLQRRSRTGVSVQTLHPSKFDHGTVLAQTPFPGIDVPENSSISELIQLLAPLGAQQLVQSIRERRFVEPIEPVKLSEDQLASLTEGKGIAHAPKITPEDRRIDWSSGPSNADILLRSSVLGRLWDDTTYTRAVGTDKKKRITYESWTLATHAKFDDQSHTLQLGDGLAVSLQHKGDDREKSNARSVQIVKSPIAADKSSAADVGAIMARDFTIESGSKNGGSKELARDMMRHGRSIPSET